MYMLIHGELCFEIVGAAQEVHRILGPGFLESVYERALAKELGIRKIRYALQQPIRVFYKQDQIGEYQADLLVDDRVILEIKAIPALLREHEAQAIHYLSATKLQLAVLLNFGAKSLQFRRIVHSR